MLDTILSKCDERYEKPECGECMDCTFEEYCPGDCEVCLDYIHNPSHSPVNAPETPNLHCVEVCVFVERKNTIHLLLLQAGSESRLLAIAQRQISDFKFLCHSKNWFTLYRQLFRIDEVINKYKTIFAIIQESAQKKPFFVRFFAFYILRSLLNPLLHRATTSRH